MISEKEIYKRLCASNQKDPDSLDFEELDKMIRWTKYNHRIEIIKTHGYNHITEFIHDQYYNHFKSLTYIGKILDYSAPRIGIIMDVIGFSKRSKGGNMRHIELNKDEVKRGILNLRGAVTQRKAAELCGCSQAFVSRLWRSKKSKS